MKMKWLRPFDLIWLRIWAHSTYLNLSKGHMEVAYHLQTNAEVWIRVEFSFDFQVALPTRA